MIQTLIANSGIILGILVMLLQIVALVLHMANKKEAEASVEAILKMIQDAGIKVPTIPPQA